MSLPVEGIMNAIRSQIDGWESDSCMRGACITLDLLIFCLAFRHAVVVETRHLNPSPSVVSSRG